MQITITVESTNHELISKSSATGLTDEAESDVIEALMDLGFDEGAITIERVSA